MRVFIAGPLTDPSDRRTEFYEAIGELCRSLGLEVFLPHLDTSAVDEPADDRVVFFQDSDGLSGCDLVIAEVTQPAHGVGAELMQAYLQHKPVICLLARGATVSRMISGNPAVEVILRYDHPDEALDELRAHLASTLGSSRPGDAMEGS